MTDYLLIESRSRQESTDVSRCFGLAANLAAKGHGVIVFLVQNGVLAVRDREFTRELDAARQAGVTLLADDFSLHERGIAGHQIAEGISPSPLELVIDRLAVGDKVIWH